MPREFHLVRHGQTEWNLQGRLQGRLDSPLTGLGRSQAEELACRLAPVPYTRLVCSPAPRAQATAQILWQGRTAPFETWDSLSEMALGPWEGRDRYEIERRWPRASRTFWQRIDRHKTLVGAESWADLADRMRAVRRRLRALTESGPVLVVAHALCLGMLRQLWTGQDWALFNPKEFLPQGEVFFLLEN